MANLTKRLFGLVLTGVLASAALTAGCDGGDSSGEKKDAKAAAAAALPAGFKLDAAPTGAQDVLALKQSAKDGDEVVVRGVVAGTDDPVAADQAMFTLADATIETCDQVPGDTCATPWDACCDTERVNKSATVQVVDASGVPLAVSLKGEGIKPMARVVVKGKVRGPVNEKLLVIDATGVFVEDGDAKAG